jgi:hypothetical protein
MLYVGHSTTISCTASQYRKWKKIVFLTVTIIILGTWTAAEEIGCSSSFGSVSAKEEVSSNQKGIRSLELSLDETFIIFYQEQRDNIYRLELSSTGESGSY